MDTWHSILSWWIKLWTKVSSLSRIQSYKLQHFVDIWINGQLFYSLIQTIFSGSKKDYVLELFYTMWVFHLKFVWESYGWLFNVLQILGYMILIWQRNLILHSVLCVLNILPFFFPPMGRCFPFLTYYHLSNGFTLFLLLKYSSSNVIPPPP